MLNEEIHHGKIALYAAPDGHISLDVRLERETIWLSLNQLTELFERDKSVISRHLNNVFNSGELERKSVVAFFATTAADGKIYQVEHFNLDAVISVGYRVNSKRGTQFRIWASQILRDHLLKGYSANENRLRDLNQAIQLVANIADRRDLSGDEAKALLRVVGEYGFALDLLDDYDHQRVSMPINSGAPLHELKPPHRLVDGAADVLTFWEREQVAKARVGREEHDAFGLVVFFGGGAAGRLACGGGCR